MRPVIGTESGALSGADGRVRGTVFGEGRPTTSRSTDTDLGPSELGIPIIFFSRLAGAVHAHVPMNSTVKHSTFTTISNILPVVASTQWRSLPSQMSYQRVPNPKHQSLHRNKTRSFE